MNAEAEGEYLRAVALEPSNSDFQTRLCVNYSEWNKLDKAVECYNRAIKLDKHHVLYMSLGNVYQRQGKLDEAIVAYKKSIELKPTFTHSLYELAGAYFKKGQYEDAIEPLQKLLQIEPRHGFGNHALGLAYLRTGNKAAAMQQYHILQNIDSNLAANLLAYIPK